MKSTPNLPAASRAQMPAALKDKAPISAKMHVKKGGPASKLVSSAKGKGMKSKSC
jgi:hypothetical protein